MTKQKEFNQYFTPVWAAEMLYNKHFSHLGSQDLLWEPTCGKGACLSVVPSHVPAVGSELDEQLIKECSVNTSRPVYHGDFRTIMFDRVNEVTALFGNPPFNCDMFEEFMSRCSNILKIGNKAGFIIPAYFFQTSATFMRFARKWYINQEMLPRDLFPGLSIPIIWASFIRENSPQIVGFNLYAELCDIKALKEAARDLLTNTIKRSGSVWKYLVMEVMANHEDGTASLDQLYRSIEGKRPTENPFWKEQIRKVVQTAPFEKVSDATYKLIY